MEVIFISGRNLLGLDYKTVMRRSKGRAGILDVESHFLNSILEHCK
jgi:hypothetical protein